MKRAIATATLAATVSIYSLCQIQFWSNRTLISWKASESCLVTIAVLLSYSARYIGKLWRFRAQRSELIRRLVFQFQFITRYHFVLTFVFMIWLLCDIFSRFFMGSMLFICFVSIVFVLSLLFSGVCQCWSITLFPEYRIGISLLHFVQNRM